MFQMSPQGGKKVCALQMWPQYHTRCVPPETRLGRSQRVSRVGRKVYHHISTPVPAMAFMAQIGHLIFSYSDGEWDFNWCDVAWIRENFDHSYMAEHVRINHFRNHYEVRRHQATLLGTRSWKFQRQSSDHLLFKSRIMFFFSVFQCFTFQLTRKNLMVKNLKRHRKNLERDVERMEASKCDFFPCTFVLPNEYHLFVEEFKRTHGSTWIMKPVRLTGPQI